MTTSQWVNVTTILVYLFCLGSCIRTAWGRPYLKYIVWTIITYVLHVLAFSTYRLLGLSLFHEDMLAINMWSQTLRIHGGITLVLVLVQVRELCHFLKH